MKLQLAAPSIDPAATLTYAVLNSIRRQYGKSNLQRRRPVFSSAPASAVKDSRQRPRSNAATASSMGTRNCTRS